MADVIGSVFCRKLTYLWLGAFRTNLDCLMQADDFLTTLSGDPWNFVCMTPSRWRFRRINEGHMFKEKTLQEFLCVTRLKTLVKKTLTAHKSLKAVLYFTYDSPVATNCRRSQKLVFVYEEFCHSNNVLRDSWQICACVLQSSQIVQKKVY